MSVKPKHINIDPPALCYLSVKGNDVTCHVINHKSTILLGFWLNFNQTRTYRHRSTCFMFYVNQRDWCHMSCDIFVNRPTNCGSRYVWVDSFYVHTNYFLNVNNLFQLFTHFWNYAQVNQLSNFWHSRKAKTKPEFTPIGV